MHQRFQKRGDVLFLDSSLVLFAMDVCKTLGLTTQLVCAIIG